jgi:site-specific DNA-cytosine methylase
MTKYKNLFPVEYNQEGDHNKFSSYYQNILKLHNKKVDIRKVKYISLFTGIGAIEVALHSIFPNAQCVAYSDIKPLGIEVYQNNFGKESTNLGDISNVTKKDIINLVKKAGGIDLLFGGFPCKNLTTLAAMTHTKTGLDGPKSGLFWKMCEIIQWLVEINPDLDIIVENNFSMRNKDRDTISDTLDGIVNKKVNVTHVDGSLVWVQRRQRYYWSTLPYTPMKYDVSLKDILEPFDRLDLNIPNSLINTGNGIWKQNRYKDKEIDCVVVEMVNKKEKLYKLKGKKVTGGRTRWCMRIHSDIFEPKDMPPQKEHYFKTHDSANVIVGPAQSIHSVIFDNRFSKDKKKFNIRYFTITELERLFMFPDGYSDKINKHPQDLFSNTILIPVIFNYLVNM